MLDNQNLREIFLPDYYGKVFLQPENFPAEQTGNQMFGDFCHSFPV
jgi:hypothetical protein